MSDLPWFGRKVGVRPASDERLRKVAARCAAILDSYGLYYRIWSEEPEPPPDVLMAPPRVYLGREPSPLRKPQNWMRCRGG
jgi:hypothetical protein